MEEKIIEFSISWLTAEQIQVFYSMLLKRPDLWLMSQEFFDDHRILDDVKKLSEATQRPVVYRTQSGNSAILTSLVRARTIVEFEESVFLNFCKIAELDPETDFKNQSGTISTLLDVGYDETRLIKRFRRESLLNQRVSG